MTLRVSTLLGFLALVLPFVAANRWSRRHQEVAHRARGDVDLRRRDVFTNARFTFYDVGLGACGQYNVASDWIVALNVDQYGSGYPGPQCFLSITIQYGGKTAQATIMDECMGCPYAGLDFSRGLFDYFADESVGVLYGTWWYNDQTPTSTSTPPPTTTWEPPPPPPPTTMSAPPPPTTTWSPPPTPPTTTSSTPAYTPSPTTSSTTSTTSTTSSTSSADYSTGLVSGLAVPTGGVVSAPDADSPENLIVINSILVDIGVALSAAEKIE